MHAICTGILYCFASRVVNMAVEMTQNPVLARDGNAVRGRGRARHDDGTSPDGRGRRAGAMAFCLSTQWSPFRQGQNGPASWG